MQPLVGDRILVVAVNIPGPVAAARLAALGASVTKIEPPSGDPLQKEAPGWYAALHNKLDVRTLDLQTPEGRGQVHLLLEQSDLLLTSYRPLSLERLGLSWSELAARYPRLSHVAITGSAAPRDDEPGHDLTYQAQAGLVTPPALPRALVADLAGADEAVTAALCLLLARERGHGRGAISVSLAEAAGRFAEPLRQGLAAPSGVLGGAFAGYNIYRAKEGWVALAALEPKFLEALCRELPVSAPTSDQFQQIFPTRTASEWEQWAARLGLPLVAVR